MQNTTSEEINENCFMRSIGFIWPKMPTFCTRLFDNYHLQYVFRCIYNRIWICIELSSSNCLHIEFHYFVKNKIIIFFSSYCSNVTQNVFLYSFDVGLFSFIWLCCCVVSWVLYVNSCIILLFGYFHLC